MSRSARDHWENVWASKDPTQVSWFESTPRTSVGMIEELRIPSDAPIIDLGGGTSALARELLDRDYVDLTVADISVTALHKAKESLGEKRKAITWVAADVREHDFSRHFAVWHDRAVFHFMTEPGDRIAYLSTLRQSMLPGGHLIVATFGPHGPTNCSGLAVARYGVDDLKKTFSGVARLVSTHLQDHETPSGRAQQFLYAHLEAL